MKVPVLKMLNVHVHLVIKFKIFLFKCWSCLLLILWVAIISLSLCGLYPKLHNMQLKAWYYYNVHILVPLDLYCVYKLWYIDYTCMICVISNINKEGIYVDNGYYVNMSMYYIASNCVYFRSRYLVWLQTKW